MREPLYAQIARELAQGIASGKFPEGSLLSSETELVSQYQASRQTIRAALRELMDLGLVSRRKGVGTRVEARVQAHGYEHSLGSLDDLVQLAVTNPRLVKHTNEVVADRDLAKDIGCAPGTRWLHIASIRQGSVPGEPPVCWTDSYVNTAYSDLGKLVRDDPKPLISELIEKHYGRRSAEVHQSISAVAMSPLLAEALQVEPGSPALRIVRRYIDRVGATIETTISVHPADRYTFSMVLKRSSVVHDPSQTT